jgi:uncharacterized protein DUF4232
MSGAAGNVNMPILLRNRSSSDCYLEGYPDATVLDASGRVLVAGTGAAGRGTYFNDGPVVQVMLRTGEPPLPAPGPGYTAPLGEAFMNFSWYDCKPLQANRLALDLPDGGGRLVIPFAMQAYYSAACDGSPNQTPTIFRGPFSPTGVEWPPGYDYIKVAISISVPHTAKRGSVLTYFVTVTDVDSRDFVLAPCADYDEMLNMKMPVATYELNCGPVGMIAAGAHATFQMQMTVPAGVAAGPNTLRWALTDGRIDPNYADTPVTIT